MAVRSGLAVGRLDEPGNDGRCAAGLEDAVQEADVELFPVREPGQGGASSNALALFAPGKPPGPLSSHDAVRWNPCRSIGSSSFWAGNRTEGRPWAGCRLGGEGPILGDFGWLVKLSPGVTGDQGVVVLAAGVAQRGPLASVEIVTHEVRF